jgi:hypothetical protein
LRQLGRSAEPEDRPIPQVSLDRSWADRAE